MRVLLWHLSAALTCICFCRPGLVATLSPADSLKYVYDSGTGFAMYEVSPPTTEKESKLKISFYDYTGASAPRCFETYAPSARLPAVCAAFSRRRCPRASRN